MSMLNCPLTFEKNTIKINTRLNFKRFIILLFNIKVIKKILISFAEREIKNGITFIVLELTGGVELVQSSNTGKFITTARRTSISSTFDKTIAEGLIGSRMSGDVVRVQVELIQTYKWLRKEDTRTLF
jgi:hypothetical protein